MSGASLQANSHKRRARRAKLFALQDGRCIWCGDKMTMKIKKSGGKPPPDYATFEHIVPYCKNGSFAQRNISLAHQRCNELRGVSRMKPALPVEMICEEAKAFVS